MFSVPGKFRAPADTPFIASLGLLLLGTYVTGHVVISANETECLDVIKECDVTESECERLDGDIKGRERVCVAMSNRGKQRDCEDAIGDLRDEISSCYKRHHKCTARYQYTDCRVQLGLDHSPDFVDASEEGNSPPTVEPVSIEIRSEKEVMHAAAVSFTEKLPEWARDSILKLSILGIINGYEDGRFGAADTLTRGQVITLLYRTLRHQDIINKPDIRKCQLFPDVTESDYMYLPVCAFMQHLFAVGEAHDYLQEGMFHPHKPMSRGEVADMLDVFLGETLTVSMGDTLEETDGFTDVPEDHPYHMSVTRIRKFGLFKGNPDGTFDPEKPLNRAEVAIVIDRVLDTIVTLNVVNLVNGAPRQGVKHGAAGSAPPASVLRSEPPIVSPLLPSPSTPPAVSTPSDPKEEQQQPIGQWEFLSAENWQPTPTLLFSNIPHLIVASDTIDIREFLPISVSMWSGQRIVWSTTIENQPEWNCRGPTGCSTDGPYLPHYLEEEGVRILAVGKNGELLAEYELPVALDEWEEGLPLCRIALASEENGSEEEVEEGHTTTTRTGRRGGKNPFKMVSQVAYQWCFAASVYSSLRWFEQEHGIEFVQDGRNGFKEWGKRLHEDIGTPHGQFEELKEHLEKKFPGCIEVDYNTDWGANVTCEELKKFFDKGCDMPMAYTCKGASKYGHVVDITDIRIDPSNPNECEIDFGDPQGSSDGPGVDGMVEGAYRQGKLNDKTGNLDMDGDERSKKCTLYGAAYICIKDKDKCPRGE